MSGTEIQAGVILDLEGNIIAKFGQLEEGVEGVNDALGKTGKAGKKSGDGLEKGAKGASMFKEESKKLNKRAKSLFVSLVKFPAVLTGISLAAAAVDFTRTITQYDRFKGQLETVFNGAKTLAEGAFKAIEEFASKTPFTLDQSVGAFQKLANLGIAPTEERLLSFGNTSAAMGKSLNDMIEAVADASTGEFERLKEFGIKASSEQDKVKFTFQGTTTTVGKNSEEIVNYLTNIGKTNFATAMSNQMLRVPGLLSNLRDGVQGLWRDLGDRGATNLFAAGIKTGIEWIQSFRDALDEGLSADNLHNKLAPWVGVFDTVLGTIQSSASAFIGWMIESYYNPLFEMVTGQKLQPEQNGYIELFKFIGRSMLELPVNARAAFTIIIGEADKWGISVSEQFQLLGNASQVLWLAITSSATSAWDAVKLGGAIAVDAIINQFAEMIASISRSIEGLPDALVPDSWIAGLRSSEQAIRDSANSQAEVRQQIAQSSSAYEAQRIILDDQRNAIKLTSTIRKQAADSAITSALADREASIAQMHALDDVKKSVDKNGLSLTHYANQLKIGSGAKDKATEAVTRNKTALQQWQAQYQKAKQAVADFPAKLRILWADFNNGVTSLGEYNQQVVKLSATYKGAVPVIDSASSASDKWWESVQKNKQAVASFPDQLLKLWSAYKQGELSLGQYNKEVTDLNRLHEDLVPALDSADDKIGTFWEGFIDKAKSAKQHIGELWQNFGSTMSGAIDEATKAVLFGTREAKKEVRQWHREQLADITEREREELAAFSGSAAEKKALEKGFQDERKTLHQEYLDKIDSAEKSAWTSIKDTAKTAVKDMIADIISMIIKSGISKLWKSLFNADSSGFNISDLFGGSGGGGFAKVSTIFKGGLAKVGAVFKGGMAKVGSIFTGGLAKAGTLFKGGIAKVSSLFSGSGGLAALGPFAAVAGVGAVLGKIKDKKQAQQTTQFNDKFATGNVTGGFQGNNINFLGQGAVGNNGAMEAFAQATSKSHADMERLRLAALEMGAQVWRGQDGMLKFTGNVSNVKALTAAMNEEGLAALKDQEASYKKQIGHLNEKGGAQKANALAQKKVAADMARSIELINSSDFSQLSENLTANLEIGATEFQSLAEKGYFTSSEISTHFGSASADIIASMGSASSISVAGLVDILTKSGSTAQGLASVGLAGDAMGGKVSEALKGMITDGTAAATTVNMIKSNIESIPTRWDVEVHTTHTSSGTNTGGNGRRDGQGLSRGTGPDGFIVPPGYPNDSYPLNVESGERVIVIPATQVRAQGNSATPAGSSQISYAATNNRGLEERLEHLISTQQEANELSASQLVVARSSNASLGQTAESQRIARNRRH